MTTAKSEPDRLATLHVSFDPAADMLVKTLYSNGYHTRIRDGVMVHPTTESMRYAVECIFTHEPELVDRGQRIIRKVLSLQDTDPVSYTFGVWPWYLEEPLAAMNPPDLNWADFIGTCLNRLLVRQRSLLAPDLVDLMSQALDRAAWRIFRRNMGPNYTNISILGASVTCVAGEVLGEPRLLAYGKRRLERLIEHRLAQGGFNEYNSPNYFCVSVEACEDALRLLQDEAAKRDWERLRRILWEDASAYFHVPTRQWAGPHSRSYSDVLADGQMNFIRRRIGEPVTREGKPGRLEPLPCPEDLAPRYRQAPAEARQFSQRFQIMPNDSEIVGTTWMGTDACLGTINHDSIWTQRRVLVGFWNAGSETACLRLRFLRDGKDFASVCAHNAQNGPAVLSSINLLMDCGNWHLHQDRRFDQTFEASDFRLRYQLQCPAGATARQLGQHAYELAAGDHRVVIYTTPSRFGPYDVRWELGHEGDTVFLDGICYAGQNRAFDFRSMDDVKVAAGLAIVGKDQPPANDIVVGAHNGKLVASWAGANLRLEAPLRAVRRDDYVAGFPFD